MRHPAGGDRIPTTTPLFLLWILLLALFVLSLFTGRYTPTGFVSPSRIVRDPLAFNLVLNLRLPRLLAELPQPYAAINRA